MGRSTIRTYGDNDDDDDADDDDDDQQCGYVLQNGHIIQTRMFVLYLRYAVYATESVLYTVQMFSSIVLVICEQCENWCRLLMPLSVLVLLCSCRAYAPSGFQTFEIVFVFVFSFRLSLCRSFVRLWISFQFIGRLLGYSDQKLIGTTPFVCQI